MAREKHPEAAAEAERTPERSYQEQLDFLNPIARPLASRKLTRKLYKCIRKAAKHKKIRRGVKEVQKFINKGEKGITVLAGDTLPIDVYCHIPIMCEDRSIPYAYVPSKSPPPWPWTVPTGPGSRSWLEAPNLCYHDQAPRGVPGDLR
ncbi:H/ACA ribonucleoprotein complex subunit 2 isoform X2 [Falco biarmicus]|uniref:H/ACA ribonucleoprotein complex subunit 2 isoform X2 n=1 Tax=Falco cherrug TaxID=345164 RepID=UPI000FFB30E8|nr:H/ACA ribonucleoprotein complex subunit 2 isoform X2 [Falco cherrug]XP_037252907.1 H/ACA ribonucleoprotein complex subunit 2 isoform X2 [Falco rusticolus]XP_055668432.1 H/ACA ribonucleoprotein complex subunit 2 isoform X2 [Falco peregrinus]XP_056205395.1 H/ACA ribonucleoprotein complex subunit 2 isoform X2 [Falco biarmicus]